MARCLGILTALVLVLTAQRTALAQSDCGAVVWDDAHRHYHCVDAGPRETVTYYEPRPVVAPPVYVNFAFNAYPWGWRPYYRPYRYGYGPTFYYSHHHQHHGHWRGWH